MNKKTQYKTTQNLVNLEPEQIDNAHDPVLRRSDVTGALVDLFIQKIPASHSVARFENLHTRRLVFGEDFIGSSETREPRTDNDDVK